MARIGRFGRRTRGGANLASMVAGLIAQQRAAEDRAIFDAYNNGGLYKGKRVTDSVLLGYIKGRRDGHSKDDANWDEWNNRFIQTKFSIDESKTLLAWKQGKKSGASVAAFYRNSLKQFPTDSAFGREIASKAADWAKSAAGAARSGARGRATSALNARVAELSQPSEDFGAATKVLEAYARRAGLIVGSQTLNDADASRLIDLLDSGIVKIGDKPLTYVDYIKMGQGDYRARTAVINLKASNGIGVKTLLKERDKAFKFLGGVRAWNDRDAYEVARADFEGDMERAGGDPYSAADAMAEYANKIKGLFGIAVQDPNIDSDFIGALNNEYLILTTGKDVGPTVSDAFNSKKGTTYANNDGTDLADDVSSVQAAIKDIQAGKAYYGQEAFGEALRVVPFQASADLLGADGMPRNLATQITNVNGDLRPVVLAGREVSRITILDEDGNPVDISGVDQATLRTNILNGTWQQQEGGVLGYEYSNSQTGRKSWGVYDAAGRLQFTEENPFAGPLGQLGDSYGVVVSEGAEAVQTLLKPGEAGRGVVATRVMFDEGVPLSERITLVKNAGEALGLDETEAGELVSGIQQVQKTREEIQRAYNNFRAEERSEGSKSMYGMGPPLPSGMGGPAISLRNGFAISAADLAAVKPVYAPPPTMRDSDGLSATSMPTIKVPVINSFTGFTTSLSSGAPPPAVTPNVNVNTGFTIPPTKTYEPTIDERLDESAAKTTAAKTGKVVAF